MINDNFQLSDKQASRLFWIFCLIHLTAWTLGPYLFRHTLPSDTLESVVWGNQWQWGYDKHPPLAPWLLAIITKLGIGFEFPIYLLAQTAVITAFWAVWKLAKQFFTPTYALIGVTLLEGIFYYNLITPKFNPTTLMTPLWALTILSFYFAVKQQKVFHWLLVGLFAGLSMLSKYESAILFAPMLFLLIFTAEGRTSFKKPGLYAGALIAILVFLPNIIWLFQQNFPAIHYALDRVHENHASFANLLLTRLYKPAYFTLEQFSAIGALFILLIPFYFAKRVVFNIPRFDRSFIWTMALGPLVATLLLSALTGMYLYGKWATPYFTLLGVFAILVLKPRLNNKTFIAYIVILSLVFSATVCGRYCFLTFGPKLTGNVNPDSYFPGEIIANQLTQEWHKKYNRPLRYVAGSHFLMVYLAGYSKDNPQPYFDWDKTQSAWIDEAKMKKEGAIFAWWIKIPNLETNNTGKIPKEIAARFPNTIALPIHYYPLLVSIKAEPAAIGVAFLPPSP